MNKLIIILTFIALIGCNNSNTSQNNQILFEELDKSILSNQSQIDELKKNIELLKDDSDFSFLYKLTHPVSAITDSIIIQLAQVELKIKNNEKIVVQNKNTEIGDFLANSLENYSIKIKDYIFSNEYIGVYDNFGLEEMQHTDFVKYYNDDKDAVLLKILIIKNRIKQRERELYFTFTSMKISDN